MKKYQFRLEQVRNVRRVQEEVALAAFQRAERHVADADRALIARRGRYVAESGLAPAGGTWDFVSDHERLARAAAALEAAGRNLADARQAAAVERSAWSQAARRVAALDRLDERQRAEHGVEVLRHLERQVDDMVNARKRADD